jgi:hypothetical protein
LPNPAAELIGAGNDVAIAIARDIPPNQSIVKRPEGGIGRQSHPAAYQRHCERQRSNPFHSGAGRQDGLLRRKGSSQ